MIRFLFYSVFIASRCFSKTSVELTCHKQDVFSPFHPHHLSAMIDFPGTPIQVVEMNHSALADPAKFYQTFTAKNKPVIIKNLADFVLSGAGNGSQKLRLVGPDSFFRDAFVDGGGTEIEAEKYKVENRHGPSEEMTFDTFIKEIDDEKRRNELYALVDLAEEENLLETIHLPWFVSCLEHRHQSPVLWYSSGDTSSVLHHDDADNILVVMAGEKRVILAHQDEWRNMYAQEGRPRGTSPVKQDMVDLNKYPKFGKVKFTKGRLEEGDGLFIPHSYWHQVVSDMDRSTRRNVAINFWWSHRDDWTWWNPAEQDKFGHLELLKNYDEMRKGREFKCTPREVNAFDQIKMMDDDGHARFKENLFTKRHPRLAKKLFGKSKSGK